MERFRNWIAPIESLEFENVTNFRVFEGRAHLNDLSFRKPSLVSFKRVNFSQASFDGTDLRGVSLIDEIWAKDQHDRHILFDDIFVEEPTDRSYRSRAIRVGEETYRKIRIALEENREYRVANDFYYREMTYRYKGAHKIKREFTVSALYGHLSGYGVRPLRAFTVLLILVGVHALGTGAISGVFTSSLDLSHTAETVQGVLASALRSLQIMSFQRVPPEPNIGQGFIDVLMRILGAVQIALFSLALRNQTRR